MTTTISLATNSCIVLGCDSLGTISLPSVRTFELSSLLFDENGKHKTDDLGNPIYLTRDMLYRLGRPLPTNQMPSVTKIFPLEGSCAALLFAGLASVGNKSLQTLVSEFIATKSYGNWKKSGITGAGTIEGLTKLLAEYINSAYKDADEGIAMEIIVSGYSKNCLDPEIFKIEISYNKDPKISSENPRGEYKIIFGGQYDVIQRVVEGIDVQGWIGIGEQLEIALNNFRNKIVDTVAANGYTAQIPTLEEVGGAFNLVAFPFKFGTLSSEVRHFSQQAAIDFVEFLVELMEKSQQFSDRIPTVGGDIHVGLIVAGEGFRWISKEHYKTRDHSVPKYKKEDI